MPLPTVSPFQFPALSALATGPFSYRYLPKAYYPNEAIEMTDYPLPDGGWNWATTRAEKFTPELFQLPQAK